MGFICPDGHIINSGDILNDDPQIAVTMLKALCLPWDLKKVPKSAEQNMAKICQLMAKLGVHVFKAYDDVGVAISQRTQMLREKRDAENKLKEAQQEIEQHQTFAEEVCAALSEGDGLKKRVDAFQKENEKLEKEKEKKEVEEQLQAKLEKATEQGWSKCSKEIRKQLPTLLDEAKEWGMKESQLKGIQETHWDSFLMGYQEGLDVAEISADHSLRETLEVPEAILPSHLIPKPVSPLADEEETEEDEEEETAKDAEEQPHSPQGQAAEDIISAEKGKDLKKIDV